MLTDKKKDGNHQYITLRVAYSKPDKEIFTVTLINIKS